MADQDLPEPGAPATSTRRVLAGALSGWLGATLLWAIGLSVSLASLNDLHSTDTPILVGFWLLVYSPVTLPASLLAWLAMARRTKHTTVWSAVLFSGLASAALLLCLNLLLRWTPASKALSKIVTPVGILDVGLIALLFALLFAAAESLARGLARGGRPALSRAARLLGIGFAIAFSGYWFNHWYQLPTYMDVRSEVAAQIQADPACKPSAAPVEGMVFLALDGMTWNVVVPLLRDGRLPRLRELLGRSSFGNLDPLYPSFSPVVWSTIATGLLQDDHGIDGWLKTLVPGTSSHLSRGPLLTSFAWWGGANSLLGFTSDLGWTTTVPIESGERRGHAMWNVAAGSGHQVGVFNWMSTWPVEPLPGYIYSSMYPTRNAYPSEVQTIADGTPANEYANRFDVRPRYKRRYELAFSLFDAWKPSVSFHFNQAIDFSHNHWADLEGGFATPQVPYQAIAPPILDAYELSDYWIGRFMDATPENYVFVIASDHGYEFNTTNHAFSPPGVLILSGGPFGCTEVLDGADIRDVAPTLLAVLGLPGLDGMPGRVLSEAFAPTLIPSLERWPDYPIAWRKLERDSSPDDDERWDELRENLKAMGYVN